MTIIGWGYGIADTAVAVSMLESAGIPVHAHSRQTVSVAWNWTHALGGIAIQVPSGRAREASAVLAGYEPVSHRRFTLRRALVLIAVWFWFGVPPPATGYFAARPAALSVQAAEEGEGSP